ncbi:hypothetical protein PV327_005136 [Microctonus hyperodae]|uniref:Uncharacterized protein n=1 Tax=Microctonus hyperodae TaxID=165561 RepID=A0AA39KZ95_MICHY|nr:hypothetical protein PV327_005136 [Microctonus hyperodae]
MGSIHKIWCSVVDHRNLEEIVGIQDDVFKVWTDDPKDIKEPLEKYGSDLKKIIIQDEGDEDIPPSIYQLLAKCTKLNYARVECRDHDRLELFLKYLPADNLEDLSINFRNTREDYHKNNDKITSRLNPLMRNVLEKTLKLKSLELNYVPISKLPYIGGMETLKSLYINTRNLPLFNFDMQKLKNLETLSISFDYIKNENTITELIRTCRKLHSIRFNASRILPRAVLNEMMSLPNLRRLHLSTTSDSYELWHNFSNLEEIRISQYKPLKSTEDEIKSFIQRSSNLKTYYFLFESCGEFNKLFHQLSCQMGHECENHYPNEWTNWYNSTPF